MRYLKENADSAKKEWKQILDKLLTDPDPDNPEKRINKLDSIKEILPEIYINPQHDGPRKIKTVYLTNPESGMIHVEWEEPSMEPKDYRITWAKVGEQYPSWRKTIGNAYPTEPHHTITGIEEGKYKVKVCARYNIGDNGTWSDEFAITIAGSI